MSDPIFDSPYLQGASAPVADELDLRNLEVIGEIPAGLRGCYLRNGPNPAFASQGDAWRRSRGRRLDRQLRLCRGVLPFGERADLNMSRKVEDPRISLRSDFARSSEAGIGWRRLPTPRLNHDNHY